MLVPLRPRALPIAVLAMCMALGSTSFAEDEVICPEPPASGVTIPVINLGTPGPIAPGGPSPLFRAQEALNHALANLQLQSPEAYSAFVSELGVLPVESREAIGLSFEDATPRFGGEEFWQNQTEILWQQMQIQAVQQERFESLMEPLLLGIQAREIPLGQ